VLQSNIGDFSCASTIPEPRRLRDLWPYFRLLSLRPEACLDEGGEGEECERGSLKSVDSCFVQSHGD
jgi:hypothetical protein